MPYVAGVFDRILSDITTPTSKGYFNVADWTRIYGNALYLKDEFQTLYGITISFTTLTTPTRTTIPTADDINNLVIDIKNVADSMGVGITGTETMRTDWGGVDTPNYIDVNVWERNLDILNIFKNTHFVTRYPRTNIATAGGSMNRQNKWR